MQDPLGSNSALTAVVVLFGLLSSCGGDQASASMEAGAEEAGRDAATDARAPQDGSIEGNRSATSTVEFEVDWKPTTVYVAEPHAQDLALEFAGAAVALDEGSGLEFTAGGHLLVEGTGLFRIDDVASADGRTVLTVSPGSLLEAAERGQITWDVHPALETAVEVQRAGAPMGWQRKGTVSFEGEYAGMTGGLEMESSPGQITIGVTAEIPAAIPYVVTAQGSLTGGLNFRGGYAFSEGEVDDFHYEVADVDMQVDFSLSGGGQSIENKMEFPLGLYIPVRLGPIPTYLGLSGKLWVSSTTESGDSHQVSGSVRTTGTVGLETTENGGVMSLVAMKGQSLRSTSGSFETSFTTGVGVVLDFPKIEFGVAALTGASTEAPKVSAGVYASLQAEVVQNVHVEVNLWTAEKRWCRVSGSNVGVSVGGEIKLFGVELGTEQLLWSQVGPESEDGDGC